MRVVMPQIVPHTEAEPFMAMARFETGDGGNPHFHGFTVGAGGPQLGRVNADMDESALGGLAPASGDDDGTDPPRRVLATRRRLATSALLMTLWCPTAARQKRRGRPRTLIPTRASRSATLMATWRRRLVSPLPLPRATLVVANLSPPGLLTAASARAPRRRPSGSFERKPLP